MQEKKPLNNTNVFIECSNRSSNINKIIRSVLNFFFFFFRRISQVQKSTKPLTANKNKNVYKKHRSININQVIKTIQFFNQYRKDNLVF